jgi:hypothetical protein
VPKESVIMSQHKLRLSKELGRLTQTRRFLWSVFATPIEDTGINGVSRSGFVVTNLGGHGITWTREELISSEREQIFRAQDHQGVFNLFFNLRFVNPALQYRWAICGDEMGHFLECKH